MKSEQSKKVFIVIPAYNEATVILNVLKEVRNAGYENIIVVDDGSSDSTYATASSAGVIALKHYINRGKGAAIKTGIEAAKILGATAIVTLDGDGQHNPNDITSMMHLLEKGYDVVLGTRLLRPEGMPRYKRVHNFIGNIFVWMLYGLWVTDSQSGFRAYSKKALKNINTHTDRYEYDSEVIREIYRHALHYIEIPIEVRYTEYSMRKSYKMNWKNGFKTLIRMILS